MNISIMKNQQTVLDSMCVLMGGIEAEQLVFGKTMVTIGSSSDIDNATDWAGHYIRKYGMGKNNSCIVLPSEMGASTLNTDVDSTNQDVEYLVTQQRNRASNLLSENKKVYKELLSFAISHGEITSQQFTDICKQYDVETKSIGVYEKVMLGYTDKLQEFLNK